MVECRPVRNLPVVDLRPMLARGIVIKDIETVKAVKSRWVAHPASSFIC